MSVAEYFAIIRRNLGLILILAILGGASLFLYSETQPKLYQSYASTMVIPRQGGSTSELVQGSNYVQNNVQTYAQLAASPYVLQPVVDQLGLQESAAALGRRISIDTPLNTTIMQIAVSDQSPEQAQRIAESVTASLTQAVHDLAPTVAGSASVRLETIAPASLPVSYVSPDRRLYLIVGVAAGLALALAIAFLREQLRSRPRNAADIAALTDLPALGEVPRLQRGQDVPHEILGQPAGQVAEAVRAIAANLKFVSVDRPTNVVIVTSAEASDGKTSIAAGLGLSIAAAGRRTLLIDADLRSPRVSDLLQVEGALGLTTVLLEEAPLSEAVQQWGHEHLWVLTGGVKSPNPGQLISSGQLSDIIAEARDDYDMVIIDTAPIGPVSDALWLASSTDGVIIVARAGKTPIRAVRDAIEAVTTTRTPVLGLVVNAVRASADSRYHGAVYGETSARRQNSLGMTRRASSPRRTR
ncbi:polysaccharide biosynthesis tyrosine autokinase [Propioniciclava soli]|uniref:non-specific protein-tyrosine kinase n=1 Tax=Propioniciclava soli TaxID=2775081 RepID=A0ABZ3C862_9ACTN